jgi:hypothetical protein
MPGSVLLNTNIALLGLPNLADSATLTSSPVAVSANGQPLSAANLQNPALPVVWRSASRASPFATYIAGNMGGFARTVSGIAFIGHSLNGYTQAYNSPPVATAQWRWRSAGWAGSQIYPILCKTTPLAILTSTNLSGAVSAIQDPDPENWDANWLTATSGGSNTSLRISFANPTYMQLGTAATTNNNTTTLPIAQIFYVTVRRTSGGGGTAPTVAFTLYENGVSRGTITGGGPVSSTTGVTYVIFWSGASLSNQGDDGRVQLQIDGAAAGGNTVEIGAAGWAKEIVAGSGYTYNDSGWMPVVLPLSYPSYTSPLTETYFPGAINVDSFFLDFQDSGNVNNYLQAGRLIVSVAYTFAVGVDYGWGISYNDYSGKARTKGGQPVNNRTYRVREFVGQLTALTQTEAYTILDNLDRMKGTTGDFLCIVHPDDPNYRYMRTMYCQQLLLNGAQNQDALISQWNIDHYQRKLLFEERL